MLCVCACALARACVELLMLSLVPEYESLLCNTSEGHFFCSGGAVGAGGSYAPASSCRQAGTGKGHASGCFPFVYFSHLIDFVLDFSLIL